MKKNIFSTLLLSLIALVASAQDCKVKTIVVYQQDGKVDTVFWPRYYTSTFYGKENPQEDDYVQCYLGFEPARDGLLFQPILTEMGRRTPYVFTTTLFSSQHIDAAVVENLLKQGTLSYCREDRLYFLDTDNWYWANGFIYVAEKSEPVYCIPGCYEGSYSLKLAMGQTYYARSVCYLDNRLYLSKEQEILTPKTISGLLRNQYPDHFLLTKTYYADINSDSIVAAHTDLFGAKTAVARQTLAQSLAAVLGQLPEATLKLQVWKEEECDDGTLYLVTITDTQIQEALSRIEEQVKAPLSIVADSSSVYVYDPKLSSGSTASTHLLGTSKCNLTMWQCEEKWGVPGNQYLVAEPQGKFTKPVLALSLNRLMSPGKEYDVTLIYAPATDEALNDSCNTYFTVYLADGLGEGIEVDRYATSIADYTVFGSTKAPYEVGPKELKRITMTYAPKRFAYWHVLQLNHTKSFISEKNRSMYCQSFRVVGVEIKVHEDAE